MREKVIGVGAFEYEIFVNRGGDKAEEEPMRIMADKVYMSKGGDIAFYQANDLFFALAGGQWSRFRKMDSV